MEEANFWISPPSRGGSLRFNFLHQQETVGPVSLWRGELLPHGFIYPWEELQGLWMAPSGGSNDRVAPSSAGSQGQTSATLAAPVPQQRLADNEGVPLAPLRASCYVILAVVLNVILNDLCCIYIHVCDQLFSKISDGKLCLSTENIWRSMIGLHKADQHSSSVILHAILPSQLRPLPQPLREEPETN